MSTTEITAKVEKIKTLQTMISEMTDEMESLKDEVKAEMTARGVDEMSISCFRVHYKEVTSNRFDTTAFKRVHNDLYNEFCKESKSRRFSIS